ncbi:MAG: flagellar basal body P-ring formation chaperone FlgA [Pyrinomonadaceae bacterium]
MKVTHASILNLSLAAVFALLCGYCVQGQSRNLIKVAGESTVNGEIVELGMIARINADRLRGDRLRGITLGYSPGIGSSRELLRPQIELAIKAAGFEDADFSLETPSKILVRRASQNIPSIQIRDAVEKAIQTRYNDSKVSTQILHVDVPADLAVPVGVVDIRASISGVRSLFEKFQVPVEIRIDGKIVRTFSATAEIAVYSEVLVAATDLAINKKLMLADVKLQKVRLEKPLTSYLRDPAVLRGVQMTKPLETGKPLAADSFAAAIVIKLGDTVRIEAYSGRIKIVATGEASANGRIGDRISVVNKQSKTVLQAIVVDEGVVRVKL